VQNKLVERGDIYKGTHCGWYSVSDECFYSETQITKDAWTGITVATETGNEVVWEEEGNWKFRLENYREKLSEWVNRSPCKSNLDHRMGTC
jgi:methionyl-tRNA synthetase